MRGRRIWWAGAGLILAAVAGVWAFRVRPAITTRLGPEVVVFDYSADACDRLDVPDTAARAFKDADGMVQLFASHHVTRRKIGPDLDRLDHRCEVVMASHENPDPAMFDDREWIAALYTRDGNRIAALVHNEYQGHRHPGRCPSGSYRRCWYNALTLATSTDTGRTFSHADPPRHLVAALPNVFQPDTGPQGVFSASNIVRHPEDGYFYTLVQLVSRRHGRGSCLMRTRDPFDPRSWRAWNGEDFAIAFQNPYRRAEVPDEFCAPVAPDRIQSMRQSLTFNTYLDRFLLIGVSSAWDPRRREMVPGVYFSVSDDLLDWSPRRLLMEAELPWTFECGDDAPVNYPSLLDPWSPSRNFDVTSRRGYLYFTRLNYSGCRSQLDRDLIRVPVTWTKER